MGASTLHMRSSNGLASARLCETTPLPGKSRPLFSTHSARCEPRQPILVLQKEIANQIAAILVHTVNCVAHHRRSNLSLSQGRTSRSRSDTSTTPYLRTTSRIGLERVLYQPEPIAVVPREVF